MLWGIGEGADGGMGQTWPSRHRVGKLVRHKMWVVATRNVNEKQRDKKCVRQFEWRVNFTSIWATLWSPVATETAKTIMFWSFLIKKIHNRLEVHCKNRVFGLCLYVYLPVSRTDISNISCPISIKSTKVVNFWAPSSHEEGIPVEEKFSIKNLTPGNVTTHWPNWTQ